MMAWRTAFPVAEGAREWILKPGDHRRRPDVARWPKTRVRSRAPLRSRLKFTDEHVQLRFGLVQSSSTRKPYPTAADFAAVRALTPGEITLQQYIEGYIVSDPDSKNVVSESPDPTVLLRPRRKRPDSLYREPRRQVGLLPEIRLPPKTTRRPASRRCASP